jgi:hypothetical protein
MAPDGMLKKSMSFLYRLSPGGKEEGREKRAR